MKANQTLGVPYTDEEIANGAEHARQQAAGIAAQIEKESSSLSGFETKQVIAMIAYLQRLGTDIGKMPEVEAAENNLDGRGN